MAIRFRKGYVGVWVPKRGWLLEHRVVAEAALGKPIPAKSPIHHVDSEQTAQNQGGNLVVCEDSAYHGLLHVRQSALDACGNANWRSCAYCKQYDDPSRMKPHSIRKEQRYYHPGCQPKTRRRAE